jgi:hypothetical protein
VTEINLLPEITAEVEKKQRKIRKIKIFSGGMLILFLLATVGVFAYWASLANELGVINGSYAEEEKKLGELVEAEGLFQGTVIKANRIEKIEPQLSSPSALFSDVYSFAGKNVMVRSISIEQTGEVGLGGSAENDAQVVSFLGELEDLTQLAGRRVTGVTVDSLRKDAEKGYRFKISLHLEESK